jgi:hypothetical protein
LQWSASVTTAKCCCSAIGQCDSFHHHLGWLDHKITPVARFPGARGAPDSRDVVIRQEALLKLAANEDAKRFEIQMDGLSWRGRVQSQIHQDLDALRTPTRKARCRHIQTTPVSRPGGRERTDSRPLKSRQRQPRRSTEPPLESPHTPEVPISRSCRPPARGDPPTAAPRWPAAARPSRG